MSSPALADRPPARRPSAAWLAVGAFLVWSVEEAGVSPGALFSAESARGLSRLLRGLLPLDLSPDFLAVVGGAVLRTVCIGLAGTALAVVLAVPLGLLATPTLFRPGTMAAGDGPLAWLLLGAHLVARALLRIFRAVPELLWALLFVVAVGLGPRAGALALAVSYAGVLGRVYADLLEDVDPGPAEMLAASGARRAPVVLFALVPQALPGLLGYTVYSLECAIRSAAVLGFVGAGGIGQELQLSMRLFEYGQVSTLLLALLGVMLAGEAVSGLMRRATRSARAGGLPSAPRWLRLLAPAAVLGSLWGSDLLGRADVGLLRRMGRFAAQLLPPDLSPAFLRSLPVPLLQTLAVAGAGTLLGVLVGAALAPLASRGLMLRPRGAPGRADLGGVLAAAVHLGTRATLAVLRGIPEMLWVLVCIVAVGFGPFAGVLALGLHTGGVLGKLWAEALDEVGPGPLEVLDAAGASAAVRSLWGAWPQARPLVASYGLLRWEFNLRVSALVGFVGGGGLGLRLYNAVQLGFHQQVCTMVLLILGLVTLSDGLSSALRRSWLTSPGVRPEPGPGPIASRLSIAARGLSS